MGFKVFSIFSSSNFFSKIFSELKRSILLALPLIASELTYAANGFIAVVMIAHLGKIELAANALVWSIYITVIVFFIGIFSSVSVLVAQSFGAKDDHSISVSFRQGLIMALLFALPMMLIMWLSPVILIWTGQDPTVIAAAKPFFYALIWAMLPFNIIFLVEQFLVGLTKTRLVMMISLLSVPLCMFFNYVFIFGKFGAPKLGLSGIGYSILATNCLMAIYLVGYLHFVKQFRHYKLFHKWWVLNRKIFLELLRVGLPLGFMYAVEVALFAAIAIMMGILGTTTLAAYQISYQYMMVPLMLLFALSQNATIRVGNEVGCNNREALKLAAAVNMGMAFICMAICGIVYIYFSSFALGFSVDLHSRALQTMISEASGFLSIVGVLLFVESIRLVSLGSLRGLKDTKFPLIASIIGFWAIAFPLAYLFSFKYKFGGEGIWWALVIGLFVAALILLVRLCRLAKHIDLVALVTKAGE